MCLCKPDGTAYHAHAGTANGNMLPAPWEIRVHVQFVDTQQNAVKLTQWTVFTDQGATLSVDQAQLHSLCLQCSKCSRHQNGSKMVFVMANSVKSYTWDN